MNLTPTDNRKILIVLPAIAALFITLLPTLKYHWPLGWDIIYHVQYAQVYAKYGFVLTDPLLNAPTGQQIGYPPLFHFLIAGLGILLGADFLQVARFLQPILAMSLVLSISYVAYRFYGVIAGLGAGFLVISSNLMSRIILPLPENLALIFLPLAVYFYYNSLKNKDIKFALYGGILFLAVILTHQAATLALFLVIISITILELVIYHDISILKNFLTFFLALILIALLSIIILYIFAPQILQILSGQIIYLASQSTSLLRNRPLSYLSYAKILGSLVLIFSIVGIAVSLKKNRRKDHIILVWIFSMFLLSNAYWFGINVISYRVLIYILLPLSIIGGFGLSYIYHQMKYYKRVSSKQFRTAFLVVIYVLCIFSGVITVMNPKNTTFGVKNEYGTVQIAPPSNSEVNLANWFRSNGNKSRSIIISNQFTGRFLTTEAEMPLHYNFVYFSSKNVPLSVLQKQKIGYIVYDKRLVIHPPAKYLYLKTVNSEFYPLYYFSQDIPSHINNIKTNSSRKVYENPDFIVYQIEY